MRFKPAILASIALPALMLALPANGQLAGGPDAGVTLHDGTLFTGRTVTIYGAVASLSGLRFNDKASSLTLTAGLWELCTDGNFQGRCEILDASSPDLAGKGLNNNVSSLRPVEARPEPIPEPRPSTGRNSGGNRGPNRGSGGRSDLTSAPIVLFDGDNRSGRAIEVTDDVRRLDRLEFNDRARSVQVNAGIWQVCEDVNFGGRCEYIGPRVNSLGSVDMSRRISSMRRTNYDRAPRQYAVSLFNGRNFDREFLGFDGAVSDLSSFNFNDTADSILITSGTWIVCEDADFRGRCEVLDRSEENLDVFELGNAITSLRPYDRLRDGRRADREPEIYRPDPQPRRGQGGYNRGNDRYASGGIEGEQSVFFPAPTDGYGERIRNGSGAATRFCRDQGFDQALYKASGRILSDVLCR